MFGRLDDVNAFSMDVERRYAPAEVREIYCDKAREFISVCKRVGISVAHSTPGMPRTNAIAESKVKPVLHGARVALRQAGLSAKFWPYACSVDTSVMHGTSSCAKDILHILRDMMVLSLTE